MSILIVEDNPVNARLITLMLHAEGYQTVLAGNGKEGLAKVSETPDIQMIITDYMMPEMDGLEFIGKVKALQAFNHIPIIVVSAHADLETVKQAKCLHCDGFLVKPIDKRQLIKQVGQLLHNQPQVLLGKNKAMDRLDIGLAEYHELLNTFADQLAATIPIVVLEQDDSDEPISDNLGRLLKELAESGSTVGADKFVLLHSKCMGRGLPARSQCPPLLRALQELELALLAYIQSQPNGMARN
jgi:CheY-like chemotaxis protein